MSLIVYAIFWEPIPPNAVGGSEWRWLKEDAEIERLNLIVGSHGSYTVSEVKELDVNCYEVRSAVSNQVQVLDEPEDVDPDEKWKNYSVSHATMRPQDLIPAFLDCIKEIAPAHYEGLMVNPFCEPPSYAMDDDNSPYWDGESCSAFLNETLWTILEEHAPEGFYFGSHPGDGSDYGFWEVEEEDDE